VAEPDTLSLDKPKPPPTLAPPKPMQGVRVLGPDGKRYVFPQGTTKDKAIAYFKIKGITGVPKEKAPTEPEAIPGFREFIDTGLSKLQESRPRWDRPEEILKDPNWYGRSARYIGGEFIGVGKAGVGIVSGGAKLLYDIGQVGLQTFRPFQDVEEKLKEQKHLGEDVKGIGKGFVDLGTIAWDMIRHFPEAEADPEKFGSTVLQTALTVDGGIKLAKGVATKLNERAYGQNAPAQGGKYGIDAPKIDVNEAIRVAHNLSNKAPSRLLRTTAFEDAYVHSKGIDIGKKFAKAETEINKEIKLHSAGIASQIDTAIPSGVIDASTEASSIFKDFDEVVKAPEKAHPSLSNMIKDAAATAPGQWTWEKVRQFRTNVGRALGTVKGPQKVVLTRTYVDLTKKLRDVTKKYGLEDSWNKYNELERKTSQQFSETLDSIRDAQSGHEVASRLSKDKALTSELARNLSKYGLDYNEVMKFVKDSSRITSTRGFKNKTLFRLAYGTPTGAPVMIASRLAGAPWIAGLGAGAAVGLATSFLVRKVRALRLSPEIIETVLSERELPGKTPLSKIKLPPEEEPPTAPTPKPKLLGPKEQPKLPSGGVVEETKTPLADEVAKTKQAGEELSGLLDEVAKKRIRKYPLEEQHAEINKIGNFVKDKIKAIGNFKADHLNWDESPELVRRQDELQKELTVLEKKYGEAKDTLISKTLTVKVPEGTRGTELGPTGRTRETKLARQAKARERVATTRAEKGPTALGGGGKEISGGGAGEAAIRAREAEEAQKRAGSPHVDISQVGVPELEEALNGLNPKLFRLVQSTRKTKSLPIDEYHEWLKYLVLEEYEKQLAYGFMKSPREAILDVRVRENPQEPGKWQVLEKLHHPEPSGEPSHDFDTKEEAESFAAELRKKLKGNR
jgi:hypothetical protein